MDRFADSDKFPIRAIPGSRQTDGQDISNGACLRRHDYNLACEMALEISCPSAQGSRVVIRIVEPDVREPNRSLAPAACGERSNEHNSEHQR
jgi:hypothetical protein